MPRRARPHNPFAFTLIELLVVIAVIALLVALLLPALRGARDSAKVTICLANQKTLATAYNLYSNDFKESLVNSWTDFDTHPTSWVDWPRDVNNIELSWGAMQAATNVSAQIDAIRRGTLYPYADNFPAYHCPSDTRDKVKANAGGALAYGTYSIPDYLNGDIPYELTIGGHWIAKRMGDLWRPSENYAFLEESDPRGLNANSWVMRLDTPNWIDVLTIWHGNQSTIGFADGHALLHRWEDPRTISMSRSQTLGTNASNNKDYQFLRKRWAVAGK